MPNCTTQRKVWSIFLLSHIYQLPLRVTKTWQNCYSRNLFKIKWRWENINPSPGWNSHWYFLLWPIQRSTSTTDWEWEMLISILARWLSYSKFLILITKWVTVSVIINLYWRSFKLTGYVLEVWNLDDRQSHSSSIYVGSLKPLDDLLSNDFTPGFVCNTFMLLHHNNAVVY